jgi:hypothetical protein
VIGVNTSGITVGNSAGTITASAASTLAATASSTGSATGASTAQASTTQNADGLLNSAVIIGNDGNLNASATRLGLAATVRNQQGEDRPFRLSVNSTQPMTLSIEGADGDTLQTIADALNRVRTVP